MTEQDVRKILMAIRVVYPSLEISGVTVGVWYHLLRDQDAAEIGAALNSYMRQSHEFPPKPGELINLVRRAKEGPKRTAAEIWALIVRAASASRPIEALRAELADDSTAIRALDSIGYDRVRYGNLERDLPFCRRDFIHAYEGMEQRDEKERPLIEYRDIRLRELVSDTAKRKELAA